ncbi:MAG TPA: branched-chain amino acid ABC transporter permease, partial [Methylomirabilota bacterium]|nr:branched-chain amino acid ABC transporter permease [Methylomirabilota bacterium]
MRQPRIPTGYVTLGVVGAVLALVPLATGDSAHYARITTLMLVYMTYAVAFNMILGHTRQLFLCLGALAGSAAYVSVVLTRELELSPWTTILLGTLVAGALGGMFSYVSVRRGLGVIFLGIVTLAFSLIFQNLIYGLRALTNGETGLVTKGMGLSVLEDQRSSYYVIFGVLMLSLFVYQLMMRSRIGVAFRALSDDEYTAELAGIDVTSYKVLAASVGSLLIGFVGALYGYRNGFISPAIYSLAGIDIVVLITLLVGGMRTLLGPVLGGVAFAVVDELV